MMLKINQMFDPTDATMRVHIMSTTCPRCQQPVQFAMHGVDHFAKERLGWHEMYNKVLEDDIKRLNRIIETLTERSK